MPAGKKFKRILFYLILSLVPLLFFIIVDLTLGILILKRDNIRTSHPYYHHSLKPCSEAHLKWGSLDYKLVTNSLGFKDNDKEIIENIKTKKERLLIIGDSFTEGLGYEFKDTFCGLIRKNLDDSVEVYNAGLTSYSPKLYYLKTKFLINKGLEFDKILIMLDLSDIQDEILYESFLPEYSYGLLKRSDILLQNYSFSYNRFFRNVIKDLAGKENTNPEIVLENELSNRASWTYKDDIFDLWGSYGADLAKKNLIKLKKLCNLHSIKMYLAVYPWPETIKHDSPDSKQVKIWKDFCHMNNIDFIDLFPYFFSQEDPDGAVKNYFIPGDDHWNAEGHKLVAEQLIQELK